MVFHVLPPFFRLFTSPTAFQAFIMINNFFRAAALSSAKIFITKAAWIDSDGFFTTFLADNCFRHLIFPYLDNTTFYNAKSNFC